MISLVKSYKQKTCFCTYEVKRDLSHYILGNLEHTGYTDTYILNSKIYLVYNYMAFRETHLTESDPVTADT